MQTPEFNKGDLAYVVASNPSKGMVNVIQVEATGYIIDNLQEYEKKGDKLIPVDKEKKIQYGFLYGDNPQVTTHMFKTRAEAIKHAQSQIDNLGKQVEEERKRTKDHLEMVETNYNNMVKSIEELMVVSEKKKGEEEKDKPVDSKPIPNEQPAKD
jgi:hypothetical protein